MSPLYVVLLTLLDASLHSIFMHRLYYGKQILCSVAINTPNLLTKHSVATLSKAMVYLYRSTSVTG